MAMAHISMATRVLIDSLVGACDTIGINHAASAVCSVSAIAAFIVLELVPKESFVVVKLKILRLTLHSLPTFNIHIDDIVKSYSWFLNVSDSDYKSTSQAGIVIGCKTCPHRVLEV